MATPTPVSFTKTYHHKPYPAIDPSRPELSAKGKTVIIADIGLNNISSAVALAFAQAGATAIAIIGDRRETVAGIKTQIEKACPSTTIRLAVVDFTNPEDVGIVAHQIRTAMGAWDVFINNADVVPDITSLMGADTEDWWRAFEVHVKFVHLFAKHFLTKCRPNATYVSVSNASPVTRDRAAKGMSGYCASKVAASKLKDFLAAENPGLRVFSVTPGMLDVQMARKNMSQADKTVADLPVDDPALASGFMLWLVSPQADLLRGRFLCAGWDVEELTAMTSRFTEDPLLLRLTIGGWPLLQHT